MPTLRESVDIKEKFAYIGSKSFDKKHRVNLGAQVFTAYKSLSQFDEFMIYLSPNGDVLLRPQLNIPAQEQWLIENPEVFKKFRNGLNDIIDGKVTKVDNLDAFFDSL